MNACWARRTSPDHHDCVAFACYCDQSCDLQPVNEIGLCDRHAAELIPNSERNGQAK